LGYKLFSMVNIQCIYSHQFGCWISSQAKHVSVAATKCILPCKANTGTIKTFTTHLTYLDDEVNLFIDAFVLDLTRVDDFGHQSWAVKTIFWEVGEHFLMLVWSWWLLFGLYNTHKDLKLCFCSFHFCCIFVSIQLWRKTFHPLNKFIAKMHM
jgi:hypothetical protein